MKPSFGLIIKRWDRISSKAKLIIIAAVAVLFAFLFPLICSITGRGFGTTVGTAVGTFHAVTEDMPKAYNEGKSDGLSATDTQAVVNQIKEVGKLDVLAATAKITDVLKDGDKYAALYEMGADVVFSIDISQAELRFGENVVEVVLPMPEVEINLDSTKTRLVDDWKRLLFDGSTKDGIDAYINSLKQIRSKIKEKIDNYAYLEKRAADSAEQQIKELAQFLVEPGVSIDVRFRDMEEGSGQ